MSLSLGLASAQVMLVPGCTDPNSHPKPANADGSSQINEPLWPYWPIGMRIHPLTRIVNAGESKANSSSIIEARIEFVDQDRDTCKASGKIRLVLVPKNTGTEGDSTDNSGLTWEQNLADPETNRQRFDEVTQTYQFRLEIPSALLKGDTSLTLYAYFLGEDGAKLNADARIK